MSKKTLHLDGMPAQNPSLVLLQARGYALGVLPADETKTEIGCWFAKKNEMQFRASDPLSLLGVVTLWEARGTSSWLPADEDLYTALAEDYLCWVPGEIVPPVSAPSGTS